MADENDTQQRLKTLEAEVAALRKEQELRKTFQRIELTIEQAQQGMEASARASTISTLCTVICASCLSSFAPNVANLTDHDSELAQAFATIYEKGVEALGQEQYTQLLAEVSKEVNVVSAIPQAIARATVSRDTGKPS